VIEAVGATLCDLAKGLNPVEQASAGRRIGAGCHGELSMMISTVHRALSFAPVYRGFQLLFGADRARRKHVAVHIRPSPGDFLVDLGCGPGDILDYLPNVRYLGFDVNPAYIKAALSRYGSRGEFRMSSVNRAELTDLFGHADIVMANGVVHHLDDEDAERLFALASSLLKSGGRLVTIDPVLHPNQGHVRRWLVSRDRGQYVRSPERYLAVARRHFSGVSECLDDHMLRFPYSHFIMECRKL
jgi:SAM-dependent methyltransferase